MFHFLCSTSHRTAILHVGVPSNRDSHGDKKNRSPGSGVSHDAMNAEKVKVFMDFDISPGDGVVRSEPAPGDTV
eukprot:symbB.v1.2.040378.t1/scaffold7182.1/size12851/2